MVPAALWMGCSNRSNDVFGALFRPLSKDESLMVPLIVTGSGDGLTTTGEDFLTARLIVLCLVLMH
jgi:hypothetical protein